MTLYGMCHSLWCHNSIIYVGMLFWVILQYTLSSCSERKEVRHITWLGLIIGGPPPVQRDS